ncbi:exosortase [Pseudoroseomonas wenyumeiae]|uniref:Exosortase n=4 Tax=Teichococcus wenyumeiae TaxID=2478470 RepID=A0ABX9VES0_9PROT|nr:exosortase A [Pseudoroseomonas wenyumeiae]RMI17131.1 exosortase [Pseudoroseomonas wenyumeiae]
MSMAHPAALPAGRDTAWPVALAVLALGLLALGWTFAEEAVAAVHVWESSTAFNHCWLVLPVAGWLAWQRRDRLAGLQPQPMPLAALAALVAGIGWLLAERLGIMEGRQLTAMAIVECFIIAVLGWRVGKAMAAPLLYLFFLVPFGAFLVPLLQHVTAWFIVSGLQVLGIPYYHDAFIIEIPAGTFLVAEACAGLRFIIAALAFGALYAFVMFRSPWRRLVVMLLAVLVPVVANGMRALGIVLLGHYLGSAEAAATDHLVYGWIFFSAVILLLVVAGLPFREDVASLPGTPAAAPHPVRRTAVLASAVLCAAAALAGPAVAVTIDQAGAAPPRIIHAVLAADGCQPEGTALRCGEDLIEARLLVFSPRTTWAGVTAERYRLTGNHDEDAIFSVKAGDADWQVRRDNEATRTVAAAAWLDGAAAGDGLRTRLRQALNSLRGAHGSPVLAVVTWQHASAGQRPSLQGRFQAQLAELAQRASDLSQQE